MITYDFFNKGNDSLYEHLYKCIKNDILSGKISSGEKLPSKRVFAKNLGISVITVESAYQQLVAEGYIYSLPKKGFYVSDIKNTLHGDILPVSENHEKIELSCNSTNVESIFSQNLLADFSTNQTPSELFPFSIWSKIIRSVLTDNRDSLTTASPCAGIPLLRQAIADFLNSYRGMNVSADQIIVGAGTEYLYGLLVQLFGHDMTYAIENPGYQKIARIYQSHKVHCEYIDMDSQGVLPLQLREKQVDILHISPSHHFPTGIVMPIGRRYELLEWANTSDNHYIIEDDYDSELRLSGQPIPSLQSIDRNERVIYMNTFTKTLSSTVRISYMILPKHLMERFNKNLSFYSCTVSNFEQYSLAYFMNQGYFEKHINRLRNYYHGKRDQLLKSMDECGLSSFVEISGENAGVHFLMKVNTSQSERSFLQTTQKRGIKLMPLSKHYHSGSSENIYVINYSSLDMNHIREIILALKECL